MKELLEIKKKICSDCSNKEKCICRICTYPGEYCTEGCGMVMKVEHFEACKQETENGR
jgi:hypothetical protein